MCNLLLQQLVARRGSGHHGIQNLLDDVNNKYYYYTRTKGLFRICYPGERPPSVETYLSPVETHCHNIEYFVPESESRSRQMSDDALARLHMGRSMIALFIVAFVTVFIAFWTGVAGCWRRSPANVTTTAILMLLTCLLSAGGMGLWHGVEYYEKEKVVGEEFYQQWSHVSIPSPRATLSRVLSSQKVFSGSGRATRRWSMYFPIRRSLPARSELDNTFWDDSTLKNIDRGRNSIFLKAQFWGMLYLF